VFLADKRLKKGRRSRCKINIYRIGYAADEKNLMKILKRKSRGHTTKLNNIIYYLIIIYLYILLLCIKPGLRYTVVSCRVPYT